MIGNSGRKTADIGIIGQVDEPLQRDGPAVLFLFHLQEGFHSWPLLLGQRGQTLGKEIQVIQVDVISNRAAAQGLTANTGQFVFTGSAVLDPCFLERVIEFRPGCRHLHHRGRFIPLGAAVADLHLENRFTQDPSLPSWDSSPDIWLDRRRVHPILLIP